MRMHAGAALSLIRADDTAIADRAARVALLAAPDAEGGDLNGATTMLLPMVMSERHIREQRGRRRVVPSGRHRTRGA